MVPVELLDVVEVALGNPDVGAMMVEVIVEWEEVVELVRDAEDEVLEDEVTEALDPPVAI